jgi:hypothetical protein
MVLALGSGLPVAFLGRMFSLQTPCVLLVFFITLAVFNLDRALGYIKKQGIGR